MKPRNASPQPPPGYRMVPVRTIYLEMRRNPVPETPSPPPGCAIRRWRRPPVEPYRRLFNAVGGKWGWSGRLLLDDGELAATLASRGLEIYRLRCGGKTAGFAELDRGDPLQTEIVYMGLAPEFIGRGLGRFLLDWAVQRAWSSGPRRVWLHTCAYDHPGALAVYLRAGFSVYNEKTEMQPYREDFLCNRMPAPD